MRNFALRRFRYHKARRAAANMHGVIPGVRLMDRLSLRFVQFRVDGVSTPLQYRAGMGANVLWLYNGATL
jgi:hypothetical protein